jgi:hypothetical protein
METIMITELMRKYIDILTENYRPSDTEDLSKSLFGLIKSNDGKFKSEKQANFFLSKTKDTENILHYTQRLSFGTSAKANASVQWTFELDKVGITKVTKSTKVGGISIYWERTEKHILANKSEKIKKLKSQIEMFKEVVKSETDKLVQVSSELDKTKQDSDEQIKLLTQYLSPAQLKSFKDDFIKKIDAMQYSYNEIEMRLAEYQDKLKKYESDLSTLI